MTKEHKINDINEMSTLWW